MLQKVPCVIFKINWVVLALQYYLQGFVCLFMNPFFPHFVYSSTVFLRLFLRDKNLVPKRDASG